MKHFVGSINQAEREKGDDDLADCSDEKGAKALLAEIAEAGS
jgi:hypothetical protein